jgi:hypothetical protein
MTATDGRVGRDHRLGIDDRARVCTRRGRTAQARCPPLGEPGEVKVGVGRDDRGATRRRRVAKRRRHDHAGCLRAGQLRLVAGVGDEGDGVTRSAFERADALDDQATVADEFAAELPGEVTQSDSHLAGLAPTWRPGR